VGEPVSIHGDLSAETDEALIRRFVESDEERAFAEIVTRHSPGIRRILYAVLNGNLDEMADVEQDILIALHRSLRSFAFRSAFKTWLYRFCRNRAIDFLRKKKRERHALSVLMENAAAEVRLAPAIGPEDIVVRRLERDRIREFLGLLPEKDRSILVMRDMEGFTIAEISEATGLPAGTVKSRLHRCRRRAALLMEELR
jgi:RNA polymerase sigma-70 factor (ECF subfamily)